MLMPRTTGDSRPRITNASCRLASKQVGVVVDPFTVTEAYTALSGASLALPYFSICLKRTLNIPSNGVSLICKRLHGHLRTRPFRANEEKTNHTAHGHTPKSKHWRSSTQGTHRYSRCFRTESTTATVFTCARTMWAGRPPTAT